jgi:hypothetical protein
MHPDHAARYRAGRATAMRAVPGRRTGGTAR